LILHTGLIDLDDRPIVPAGAPFGVRHRALQSELRDFEERLGKAIEALEELESPRGGGQKPARDEYLFVLEIWMLWELCTTQNPRTRHTVEDWPFADFVRWVGRKVDPAFAGTRTLNKIRTTFGGS
jgi:hypothetical protein